MDHRRDHSSRRWIAALKPGPFNNNPCPGGARGGAVPVVLFQSGITVIVGRSKKSVSVSWLILDIDPISDIRVAPGLEVQPFH